MTAARLSKVAGLALWLAGAPALGQEPDRYRWKLEDTVDGCQVHTSPVAGKAYIAAGSTCTFAADLEVVGAVLRDIESYPEWMEDCAQTKLLKVVDRGQEIYVFWFRQHIPVFTDRDIVLKSALTVDGEGRRVVEAAVAADVPYDSGKGYVRMPMFTAVWVLEKLGERRTRVTYMIDPELGPGLPVGAANDIIKLIPFKSLRRMMKMARLQKYVDGARAASAVGSGAGLAKGFAPAGAP